MDDTNDINVVGTTRGSGMLWIASKKGGYHYDSIHIFNMQTVVRNVNTSAVDSEDLVWVRSYGARSQRVLPIAWYLTHRALEL